MCGRFTLRTPAAILADFFGLSDLPGLTPRYNIAPSQPVGTVRETETGREWIELRWGLVPNWAKEPSIGNRMINARAETVAVQPVTRLRSPVSKPTTSALSPRASSSSWDWRVSPQAW